MTVGLLNFQQHRIEELIGASYEEVRKHNCKESQCLYLQVIPPITNHKCISEEIRGMEG